MSKVNEWKHLKIPFDVIEVATENFKTLIGRGGYGWVYKGKLLVSEKETMVAVKRLNEQHGQGLKEFLTEIQSLSGQQHPNLISLVGYCDEGREKSIVYEYAERGSLDQYLIRCSGKTTSTTLTWLQRLKICTDAARGLDYLHHHVGGHRTIIHRDIKSSNILIDENWVGKISDLGLSRLSVTGFGMSDIVSNGCGTQGYCEPEYNSTGVVTKKSDVYSFGVVLFEVLCGRLCLTESEDGFRLSSISAKYHYKKNSLYKIMDDSLREHIGTYSMTKFAAIAYRCLHDDREQRPAMDVVVKELEEALKYQEEYEFQKEDDTDDTEYRETKLQRDVEEVRKYQPPAGVVEMSITPGASSSSSSMPKRFKYDVFISFRGEDTRQTFVGHLYQALKDKGIYTYIDDKKIQKGKSVSDDLFQSIQDSKFYIIVFSKNYASSSWCLEELVKIMECQKMTGHTAYPVFYDVEPTEIRKLSGAVKEAFVEHEKKEDAGKWREAMKEASNLAGWELKATANGHEAEFIKKIVREISLELRPINSGFDEKLVGMETRVKEVVESLEMGIDDVRMIGIKGMGGAGKTTTARAVFDHLSNDDFEVKKFVENVRGDGSKSGLKKLQEQVLSEVLKERVTLDNVHDGKNMMKERMCGKKVLLVLDDVDHIDQLEALAGDPNWFKPGSRILITTRDEQLLVAHRVKLIRDINLLSDKEAICLLSRYAFGMDIPSQEYEELSWKVVDYAVGLPLTVKVLGSFLFGKDASEWVDAIKRLEKIPEKETLKKLEVSYIGLEDDYKEIFLDIACILKGHEREHAIRVLESCGFYARNGLKVLEQRSLITISKDGILGMHDHIQEMGKSIVRREHPDEPNKHTRLWIGKEADEILANDMGTEVTRCIRLYFSNVTSKVLMKGIEKMKKLRYLEVSFIQDFFLEGDNERGSKGDNERGSRLDEATQYFPNSLKYLKCFYHPFLYFPKTFQADNLVGLEIEWSPMEQLWEDGAKVLEKLKFLSLLGTRLNTFDFRITPNLERLTLRCSSELKEICMPASCPKLKYLRISECPMSRTFDLELTPNLETLSLTNCREFVELDVSVACPNLKNLNLSNSSFRSLDLELIPNLEILDLEDCDQLVEINAPAGCLKKLVKLKLNGCCSLEIPEDLGRLECLENLENPPQSLSPTEDEGESDEDENDEGKNYTFDDLLQILAENPSYKDRIIDLYMWENISFELSLERCQDILRFKGNIDDWED